jgi:4'-phosphopantetheinyl transferase
LKIAPPLPESPQVKLIAVPLDVPLAVEVSLARALSPDERERADRFAFLHHRRRFVVARGRLRAALGRELGLPPESVRIELDGNHKPYVRGRLRFNLAHSLELALIALGRDEELGVDLELLRPLRRREALAAAVFTERERHLLDELPEAERDHAFLTAWTRKESYLKALGFGLSVSPSAVEVDHGRFILRSFAPARGYLGALTVARR